MLRTAHGDVPTPAFMPVGTKATVKAVDPDELRALGTADPARQHLPPALPARARTLIAELGGLHRFMAWDGPILTDSGGFQVFSLRDTMLALDDEGVTFRSVYDGEPARLTPERVGRDPGRSSARTSRCASTSARPPASPRRSSRRPCDARRSGPSASAPRRAAPGQLLFGIAQGAADPELRRRSIAELVELDFDGYALGGLAVGEEREEMFDDDRLGGAAAARPTGRATSWASATPRGSST